MADRLTASTMDPDTMDHVEVPIIDTDEPLLDVVHKLSHFITMAVSDTAYSFEQMQYGSRGHGLRQLVHALAEDSHNPLIIVALMILKWEFSNAAEDDWGLNGSRGSACEFVAWQFLCHLNQRETIEFLLEELPIPSRTSANLAQAERGTSGLGSLRQDSHHAGDETSPLLSSPLSVYRIFARKRHTESQSTHATSRSHTSQTSYLDALNSQKYSRFCGLNALEIAAVAHAKTFLSQRAVQRVVDDIWNGEIVFWDSLTVHTKKKPQLFNERTADPYSRLRVPLYRKVFEAAFFVSFLLLYYAVLVERKQTGIGILEAGLYLWIVAFAYDELSGIVDAGVLFYQMDFWSLWNLGIIGVGIAFVIARIIGLAKQDDSITDLSFDILSLEALFLVPRICSLVSLNSYFGSLIPVLKEMTKAFLRFLPVVFVLYIGFLTTFTMLARDRLTLREMSWILVKVFFGSNVLGFDIANDISPIFGYGLMLIFVSMTNLLLISSLISLMSMSLEGVMLHAREEYLFQLSIYVLESINSRRLTYFMPPLNLIPLLCIRPMRLFLTAGAVRRVRIVLLRATHLPFVALIWAYERTRRKIHRRSSQLPPTFAAPGSGHRTFTLETSPGCRDPLHPSVDDFRRSGPRKEESSVDQQAGTRELGRAARVDQLADVVDAVERLRVRVEQVTATVAVSQRRR